MGAGASAPITSRPFVLCGLLALLCLEPSLAKWHFPGKRGNGGGTGTASASTDPDVFWNNDGNMAGSTSSAPATNGGGGSGSGDHGASLLSFDFDWQQIQKWPAVQWPIHLFGWAKSILMYQPPVGIVTAWTVYHLVSSGRLFRWGDSDAQDEASEQALSKKSSRLDRHYGRALDLDKDDLEYQNFGGIERVRRRLLWRALEEHPTIHNEKMNKNKNKKVIQEHAPDQQELLETLVGSLVQLMKISFPPGGSHADYLHDLLKNVAIAEHAWYQYNQSSSIKIDPELARLLELAMQTAQNRVMDSLLRLTRDRLVRTSFRLSRTVQHWKKRVQSQSGVWPLVRQIMVGSFEGDRMRLAFAESAYQAEVTRLGTVVHFLLQRPSGMSDKALPMAVQKTYMAETAQPKPRTTWKSRVSQLSDISNWSLRFNADGRGKIQLQQYEDALRIGGPGALNVLLEDSTQNKWLATSKEWCGQARRILLDILEETVETSIEKNDSTAMEYPVQIQKLKHNWMVQEYSQGRGKDTPVALEEISNPWTTVFRMARDLHQVRRVGDGKSVKWRDANIIHYIQQWDLLGIPSALLHIALAQAVHNRLVPHWPKMKAFLQETFEIGNEIFQRRFWGPIRDLLVELMYRDTNKLLTGVSSQDEEVSLDYMLRDLGFGDGTPETRHEAMLKATRQYEDDMASGLMRHALGGRLIRLILIQVQQLKVGMLNAADTVDVLLKTNKFNIQLLAIIPAFVIVTVGTKIFFRFLFTVKHKDLRPMKAVHSEMTGYLNQLESLLLLADTKDKETRRVPSSNSSQKGSTESTNTDNITAMDALGNRQLGEFVLYLYDYLVLLDYSSPQPFPSWQCDGIHQSMVEFLGPQGSLSRMGLQDQVRLVEHVKRKHEELAKNL